MKRNDPMTTFNNLVALKIEGFASRSNSRTIIVPISSIPTAVAMASETFVLLNQAQLELV